MISIKDLYNVLAAMVPLYVAMILAYGSVRWWKIFTSVQCSGINRFVAVFAVPLLSFHFISNNNPYQMDGKFILADTISKLLVFTVLVIWCRFASNGSLDWLITLFSVATLPNTLVMGIPLLDSMYGHFYGGLMVQLVVLQCIIWYTLLLFLFEYRAARALVMEQFPDTAASIISFKVDSDVVSLDGREPIQTQAEVRGDGKIKVTIRRSTSSRSHAFSSFPSPRSLGLASMPSSKAITPRPSNMTGAEIYSIHSSRINTPKDVNSLMSTRAVSPRQSNFTASDIYSVQSSRGPTPRVSNVNEENYREIHGVTRGPNSHFKSQAAPNGFSINPLPGAYSSASNGKIPQIGKRIPEPKASPRLEDDGKELHMFVWSSTASPVSDGGLHVFGGTDFGLADTANAVNEPKEVRMHIRSCSDQTPNGDAHEARRPSPAPHVTSTDEFSFRSKANLHGQEETLQGENEKSRLSVSKSPKDPMIDHKPKEMPPTSVMVKLILQMVGRKLIRNPNTYSSLIGLAWALISYRWNIVMPKIITGSIKILSDAGLGLAMFSLGLFMALQPRLIACGTSIAAFAMAVRFLTGPAVMAASSAAVGLRGIDLHAAIVQAALPQGIVPFVFAREYDLHPDILSTAVIFGMLIALPITLLYYVFLGL